MHATLELQVRKTIRLDVPDTIERELILPVPRERVWAALTQPASLSAWFGTRATVDLRPGGAVTFVWDATPELQAESTGVIEVVDPPHRFTFRWRQRASEATADRPTTRVEFTLDEHHEGTRLRLVESGFASLPPDLRGPRRDRNALGWTRELGDLVVFLTDAPQAR
jgi:uncharacterized protein YndB with AHSA1/START domain